MIKNKLKVLSLFSGIGAFEKALERQEIGYDLVNYCEIDKYASKSYSLIHNIPEDLNLGDISKVQADKIPEFDLMTWGFPCTDISTVGEQKGIIEGETKSGLYYEGLRILQSKKPQYSIIENVKALTHKKFESEFSQIIGDLDKAGYNSYWSILNAKNYGVPQNRERVFVVSIRKDVDDGLFKFPSQKQLNKTLYDIVQGYILDDRDKGFGVKKHKDYCPTQRANRSGLKVIDDQENQRKLTATESLLLMGFDENDYNVLHTNRVSDSQIFKMAGNSIVVNVLEEIFKQLFILRGRKDGN